MKVEELKAWLERGLVSSCNPDWDALHYRIIVVDRVVNNDGTLFKLLLSCKMWKRINLNYPVPGFQKEHKSTAFYLTTIELI